MYTVKYKCLICHELVTRDFPDAEIWDVEFVVNDDELMIASGKVFCPGCGQKAPIRVTIYDDAIAQVVSEKIISPMHYGSCDIWNKGNKESIECNLCDGSGSIEITKKTHKQDDMLFISYGDCPLCMGKGYLESNNE